MKKPVMRYGMVPITSFVRSKAGMTLDSAYQAWLSDIEIRQGARAAIKKAGEIYTAGIAVSLCLNQYAASPREVPAGMCCIDWSLMHTEVKNGEEVTTSAFQRFVDAFYCDEYLGDILSLNENTPQEVRAILLDFSKDEHKFQVEKWQEDKAAERRRKLNEKLPSTATCDECGEEFDTNGLDCTLERNDGAEWIVCSCPHCGANYWHRLRELKKGKRNAR